MRTIGRFEFPESQEEAARWEPTILLRGLHAYVVAVAVTRIEGKWACYIVPLLDGQTSHKAALELWQTDGAKCDELLANALFPSMSDIPYAR